MLLDYRRGRHFPECVDIVRISRETDYQYLRHANLG
jgi:hypothetical protein